MINIRYGRSFGETLSPFKIIFHILTAVTVLFFVFLIFSDKGVKKNDELENLVLKSEERYRKALNEYKDLKRKIELFKNNEYYQQEVIHKEIGFIKDNERIYIFEEK